MRRHKHAHELIDIRKTNDTYAPRTPRPARSWRRVHPDKQTRDRCRLLALLTGTGVLR